MWTLGPLGFATPLLLVGLLVLPVLWLLLRAVPPAPIRRRFPGVALLLGLRDDDTETDKTPWWLLLLRMLAVAAAIVAFAGPVLNPATDRMGSGPLLVLMDGSWADARDWPRRIERAETLVAEAERAGRPVAVMLATENAAPDFQSGTWAARIEGLRPNAWSPDYAELTLPEGDFATFWLSDGIDHPGRADLLATLEGRGDVTVFQGPPSAIALRPATFDDGVIQLRAVRLPVAEETQAEVIATGPDPAGIERELARVPLTFAPNATEAEVALSLPPELRNRITRFQIEGVRSAAAVSLADDSLRRRKVALIGDGPEEGLQLLSPTHFLRQALDPVADLIEGSLTDALLASPDVVVLADVAQLSQTETDDLLDWLDGGGLLLRFAGPRLAASEVSRLAEDPLMPVRLREGGRSIGGAMSWGEPKALAPFEDTSPFHGLGVPDDVQVTEQVLAQPDPDLAARTIAALSDGTPLVTRKPVGQGQVVLFHVTANAEWSSLPLSGLFVQMLERLAVSTRPSVPEAEDLAGQIWTPEAVLDGFGTLDRTDRLAGVQGEVLAVAEVGPDLPPGIYAAEDRHVALNVFDAATPLVAADWGGLSVQGMEGVPEQPLAGWFLGAALLLLMVDILAALRVSGRLGPLAAVLLLALTTPEAHAQDDRRAIAATETVRLAFVETDDPRVNQLAEAGLRGVSMRLYERTSVEPGQPLGVDPETDELAFFPFLYWPVTATQPQPSPEAYAKLNDYLRTGGMILFDTRDGDVSGMGETPEGWNLQKLASGLDIPPLEQIPEDHVLTRTFYLLQDFPGRFTNPELWVEASPATEAADGMPFRNLNDGVTPVVIGGNDWASAWAVDPNGIPMVPVGRGLGGDRQREIAWRFGVNLVMHVLTGNYKSDQVHVPALLERLGN